MTSLRARLTLAAFGLACTVSLAAQSSPVPQPFPTPGQPQSQQPPASEPWTAAPATKLDPNAPTEASLGLPIYPSAQFLVSYDAGRGQRYYLFGTNTDFLELVTYYKDALSQRGELVYDAPAVHMFEVGRFREETMAFPPGVTIKDYTWNGSDGYLHVRANAPPARFRTIIQIVPAPTIP